MPGSNTRSPNMLPHESPVSVFDFSELAHVNEENLKLHLPSYFGSERTLDSVTATSTECDDSLSSHSTAHDCESAGAKSSTEKSKRSIFGKYWNTTGEQPVELKRSPSMEEDGEPEEYLLDESPMGTIPPPKLQPRQVPSSPQRRSIFGEKCVQSYSEPSLPSLDQPHCQPLQQKSYSTSRLLARPPTSILRQSSCTGRTSRSSVRFDEKIKVVIFQPPQIMWSSDDWARHFAC